MPTFKTTQTIFNNPWLEEINDYSNLQISNQSLPSRSSWNIDAPMTIKDVKLWEQIYYSSGDIGIYASWDPYEEFYIIVHNLFINTKYGVEEFYGPNASEQVQKRAKELGINLTPS